jgi:diguanylate cyclase (GGDEF)-like protein
VGFAILNYDKNGGMMAIISSIFQAKFRRNFTVFYMLSSILPLLILIFIILQYVKPMLDENLLIDLNPIFLYGVIAMLIPSILSMALGYQWIGLIEKFSKEIKSKSAQIKRKKPDLDKDQSELADIHEVFNELQGDLEDKMDKLDEVTKQLLELNVKLEAMATIDPLTSLFNRRYFDLKLVEEASLAEREKQDLSLMMIDFDDFKNYNDSYGHQTGDKLLQEVSAVIKGSLRRSDMVFRYGGDEFSVIVPGCNINTAERIANKIVTMISETRFKSFEGKDLDGITISCGVACYSGDLESFLGTADSCLFAAKEAGKNCVVIS